MATLEEALATFQWLCAGLPPCPERFCTGLLGILALDLGDTGHVSFTCMDLILMGTMSFDHGTLHIKCAPLFVSCMRIQLYLNNRV